MEFWFCEKCGKRVVADDLKGGAGRDADGKVFCAACAAAAPPPRAGATPAGGTIRNSGSLKTMQAAERAAPAPTPATAVRKSDTATVRAPARGETSRLHAHDRASQQRMSPAQAESDMPMFAMGGAAAVLIIGGLVFAFSGSSKPTPLETAAHETPKSRPPTPDPVPVAVPAQTNSAAVRPASASVGTATATTAPVSPAPLPPPAPARVEIVSEESKASDAFAILEKKIPDIDGNDKKAAALDEFIGKYSEAIVTARARRLKSSILNPEPVKPVQPTPSPPAFAPGENAATAMQRASEKVKQGDYAGAVAEYDRLIGANDKVFAFFQNRADAKRQLGDFEGVLADADKALALNDANLPGWLLRAIACTALKRDEDVRTSLDKAAALSGMDAQTLSKRLAAEFQRARNIGAGKAFESKAPASGEDFMARGAYYLALNKRAQALSDFNEALKRDATLGPSKGLFMQLAAMAREDKNFAGALQYLKQWAESKPETALALNAYAWELLTCADEKLIDARAALPFAEKAVELSKNKDPAILDTLALAYFKNKRIGTAISTEQKAIELLPAGTTPDARKEYDKRLADFKAADATPSNPIERQ